MYNNTYNLGAMMSFTIVIGIMMIWLFGMFAERDSADWNKTFEKKGMRITRIVLMCIWSIYVVAPLIMLILGWNKIRDNQKVSYVSYIMLGLSLLFYEITFRQSPRSIWVKIRKVFAYTLISGLYIAVLPTTIMQFTTGRVVGVYGNAIGTILIGNALIYGITILVIWLLLKQYKGDKYVPYTKKEPTVEPLDTSEKHDEQDAIMSKQDSLSTPTTPSENNNINASTEIRESQTSSNTDAQKRTTNVSEMTPRQGAFVKETNLTINTVLKNILQFFKRTWKWIAGIAVFALLIIGGIALYNYIHDDYIPQKKLDKAVADILENFNTENRKTEYAYWMLCRKHDWGYEDVNSSVIRERLSTYQEEAFSCIEKMAFGGNAEWQWKLGMMYYCGDEEYVYIGKPNYEKAAYWFLESAKNGYTESFNSIGICYKNGIGVSKDLKKAVEWLRQGAEAGDPLAQKNYGDLFYYDKAKTYLLTQQDMFEHYFGSIKDWDEYRKLKKKGLTDSQTERLYRNLIFKNTFRTNFTTKDDFNRWAHSKTPEQRDQYLLSYFKKIIPTDIEQAKYWWGKSAAQGNEEAKERLQKIYN